MAKKRGRRPVTLDNNGAYLGEIKPPQASTDPDVWKQVVTAGTARPPYVAAVSLGFPDAAHDTWYFPTQDAILAGKAEAALDTLVETGDKVGAAIAKVAEVGAGLLGNLGPILLGLAALYVLFGFSARRD